MHLFPKIEVGGFILDLSAILMLTVTVVIVFALARLCTRNLSVENPSKLQNFMEWVVEFTQGIVASAMDFKKGKSYVGLALTLILFIFIANILGLPFAIITEAHHPITIFGFELIGSGGPHAEYLWWKSPTADLSITAGLAVIVFIMTNYLGLKHNRKHYLKHYTEPFLIFLPLNIIENLMKPVALALRLFANIFAGEVILGTIVKAGLLGIPFIAIWQGFSIFVGGLQAFIFVMLSMVYIGQASIHEEH